MPLNSGFISACSITFTLMNIYVINKVLSDYTSGSAVIAAPTLVRCLEIFEEEFEGYSNEIQSAIKTSHFKVFEAVNHDEGVISFVYGGG